ncbi:MAG: hypothetical protein PHC66_01825 [Candidatus Nanoarchaeia archaeon]|nr:hypothetical protein [Candidatus Nanoarchaeia archaeon]MDD5239026.1 hypothetical protein [Candidatus Nanoarchaeia archaeon]
MPIKDKNKTLIKFRSSNYEILNDFLKDVFYKDENLSAPAYELMRLIYDRKELGLSAANWKSYIETIFNTKQVSAEDSALLDGIILKHNITDTKRGSKPYENLLGMHSKGRLSLSEAEKQVLEKALKWNSCVSSYYSILNKLKAIGLVEKKQGRYHKSRSIFDRFTQIRSFIEKFETDIRS